MITGTRTVMLFIKPCAMSRKVSANGGPTGKVDGCGTWRALLASRSTFPTRITANVALIAEGEKDALNLERAAPGLPDNGGKWRYAATCNIGGAGKWLEEYPQGAKAR